MSREKIKFGLVGAGRIAKTYVQALTNCEELAELVAVADISQEAADAIAQEVNCQSFTDFKEMAKEADIDAAIVCTPPNSHPEISIYLLGQKKHVLCEKPLSISIQSAKEMQATAAKNGVILATASIYRYVEDVLVAKDLIDSGIIGELVQVDNAFTEQVDMSDRWNCNPGISGGGVMSDKGTHSVDIMRYFLGPLAEVYVVEVKRMQPLRVEDHVQVFVKSANKTRGLIDLSWSLNKKLDDYIRIYGTEGIISLGWKTSKYFQYQAEEWVEFGKGYDKTQAYSSLIENFVKAIRCEEELLVTASDVIASVEAIAATYMSFHKNHWIPLAIAGNIVPIVKSTATIHSTAIVEEGVIIGERTAIWDNVHIRKSSRVGEDCIIEEKTYIAYNVRIGNRVKINSFVYICNGVTIEDGVMIGAGTVFTNDLFPRAATLDLKRLRPSETTEHTLGTIVKMGASIGAGCTIGNNLYIGKYAMVGIGSLVTESVPDFHLAIGHPARSIGCVCRCGQILMYFDCLTEQIKKTQRLTCSACGSKYKFYKKSVTVD